MVIGGKASNPLSTESCQLEEDPFGTDRITCIDQESALLNYAYYPILFLVGDEYETCS